MVNAVQNMSKTYFLSLTSLLQLLRDITELQILGEISFNKSLYEGLNAENHRTKVIPGYFMAFLHKCPRKTVPSLETPV